MEVVLEGLDSFQPQYEETILRGRKVLVEREGEQAKLVRVLSTNPNDFLDPSLFPGSIVSFETK